VSKSWDGNTSDIAVFQERAQALMAALQNAPRPRYLIADSKLYHEDNAPNLQKLGFITRIPNTLGAVSQVIAQALTWDTWHRLDATTRYQCIELCHTTWKVIREIWGTQKVLFFEINRLWKRP